MRVEQFLRASARRSGDKVALVAGDRRFTFAEIDAASDRLAAALSRGGVARGDRVAVYMDNCWEAVVAVFAVMKAGAVYCPINPSTKADKLAWLLGHCRASALILQDRLAAGAAGALAQGHSVKLNVIAGGAVPPGWRDCIRFDDAIAGPADPALEARAGIDLDLAMLIYTSGSTGLPKGVMITHQNVAASCASIISYLRNTPDDVILNVLPISFELRALPGADAPPAPGRRWCSKSHLRSRARSSRRWRPIAPPACRSCRPSRRPSCR